MESELSPSISAALESATAEKLRQYQELLRSSPEDAPSFWDVVLITAGDEEQQKSYEQQVQQKVARGEVPRWIRYLVVSDPPGAKIGNGGATMHAIEQLESKVPAEELENAKVLLIHAGGYSQRLPSVSVLGKAFLALPFGCPMFQMMEAVLMMFIDLPSRMAPGIFLACPDIIFLYNGKGDWNFSQPGITAIGHPASLEIARTHGVYVVENMTELRERYTKDPSSPTMLSGVRQFLHKLSPERLRAAGAIIPGTDQTYVDICYYMDYPTAWKLLKFYRDNKPLTCEIDAYGDFLQALGPDANTEYCKNVANVTIATEGLVAMREKVFHLLKGTEFRVCIFHEAQFNHVGTTREYLYHFRDNHTFLKACQVLPEVMVADVEVEEEMEGGSKQANSPSAKRRKQSHFDGCIVMHSLLHNKTSISVGAGSVVEYSTLEQGVKIGKNCIVSNAHICANLDIPDNSFLHTVAVRVDGTIQYATFAFDIFDNMKAKEPFKQAANLKYCNQKMSVTQERLGYASDDVSSLWPPETTTCSLWEARLFPVFPSRLLSTQHAVSMIRSLRELQEPLSKAGERCRLSMADMLRLKSTSALLDYHSELREKILKLQH